MFQSHLRELHGSRACLWGMLGFMARWAGEDHELLCWVLAVGMVLGKEFQLLPQGSAELREFSGTAALGQERGRNGRNSPTGNRAGVHTGICVGRTHPGTGDNCGEELPWTDRSILLPLWGGGDSVKDGGLGSKGKKHCIWEGGA